MEAESTRDSGAVSLLPGERALDRLQCNHIRSGRSYEGHLHITSQRLIYVPWPAAEARGAAPFAIALAEVSGVGVAPRGSNWRDGAWRRRLQVTRSSGVTELFVVWRANKASLLIEQAVRGITG